MSRTPQEEVTHLRSILQALSTISQFRGRAAELIPEVMRQAMTLTGATGMVFERLHGDSLVYDYAAGTLADHVGTCVAVATSLSGRTLTERAVQTAADAYRDPRVDRAVAQAVGAASMVAIPLDFSGASVGVLKATWQEPNGFSDDDVETLILLGGLTAAAIGRQLLLERSEDASEALARALHLAQHREAEHRHAAETDVLTGLANRRALEAALRIAVAHWSPQQGSALLFIDLDGFKHINDRFGHAAGDAALQRMAEILRRCTRSHDLVARLGGDEFVVLLNRLSDPAIHAAVAAERILDAVMADNALQEDLPQLRLSVGAALVDRPGLQADTVLAEADRAMYSDKTEA